MFTIFRLFHFGLTCFADCSISLGHSVVVVVVCNISQCALRMSENHKMFAFESGIRKLDQDHFCRSQIGQNQSVHTSAEKLILPLNLPLIQSPFNPSSQLSHIPYVVSKTSRMDNRRPTTHARGSAVKAPATGLRL